MIPERSAKAKAALDVFFDGYNDVHFYVEDTAYQNIYQAILRRLFPRVKISQIFPLDGKLNVLRHAGDDAGNAVLSKLRVYLLDKDFDDLLGKLVVLPGVFYLRRYCIENYLLDDERAVVEFILENSPKSERSLVVSKLDYPRTRERLVSDSRSLFQLFYLVQAYSLGLQNAKLPPERFVSDSNRSIFDAVKIEQYRRSVGDALIEANVIQSYADLDSMSASACAVRRRMAPDMHISGKFLLKLLRLRLVHAQLVRNVDVDVMLYSLARNGRLDKLRELGRRIRKFLTSHSQI